MAVHILIVFAVPFRGPRAVVRPETVVALPWHFLACPADDVEGAGVARLFHSTVLAVRNWVAACHG
jgi:hypothetical protein